jgi:hypothetical protein
MTQNHRTRSRAGVNRRARLCRTLVVGFLALAAADTAAATLVTPHATERRLLSVSRLAARAADRRREAPARRVSVRCGTGHALGRMVVQGRPPRLRPVLLGPSNRRRRDRRLPGLAVGEGDVTGAREAASDCACKRRRRPATPRAMGAHSGDGGTVRLGARRSGQDRRRAGQLCVCRERRARRSSGSPYGEVDNPARRNGDELAPSCGDPSRLVVMGLPLGQCGGRLQAA